MAACVTISGGVVTFTADPPESCAGYILLDAVDYQEIIQTQPFFGLPDPTSYATAWSIGFGVPVLIGLIAYAVAKVW